MKSISKPFCHCVMLRFRNKLIFIENIYYIEPASERNHKIAVKSAAITDKNTTSDSQKDRCRSTACRIFPRELYTPISI